MEELWQRLVAGSSNFTLYALLPTLVVNVTYYAGILFCFGFDLVPGWRKYKIQPRENDRAALWRCLRHVTLNKFMSEIPMTFAAYPAFVWLGVAKAGPLPGGWTIAGTLVFCFVVEDAWHYFAHRSLHTRWGFQKIHYLHHHYTTPFGPSANYAHPLESLWTGFGTVLPVLILRPHLYTMLIWIAARQLQAISVHIGYDFPFRPSRFLPFVGGARFHDRHHRRFNRNYAPTFVWLDRLLGTADEDHLGPRAAGTAEMPVIASE